MIEKERLHPDDQAVWHGFISYICGKWEIARRYKVDSIIEIGVRAGYAAWAFLQAHPNAKYTGFDNYSYGTYPEWAKENLLKGGDVTINIRDSQEVADLGVKADLVHVDGDHSVAGVKHDLDLALKAVNPGGIILIDDYDRIPAVKQGVDEWLAVHPALKWRYTETFTGDITIYAPAESKGELLVFHHGLGDVLLFLPLFYKLRETGKHNIAFQEGLGFTPLVEGSIETPAGDFDYASLGYDSYQIVRFEMSEGTDLTKTELCASKEFGIEPDALSALKKHVSANKVIGVHFQGTCLPGATNPDEATAKMIWDEIKEAGYVPLEVNFEHLFHNPVNVKYDWVDRSTRGIAPDVNILLAVLSGCRGFLGVASGVWVAATEVNKNSCFLEKGHKLENYFREDGDRIDINNYRKGSVKAWLSTLS